MKGREPNILIKNIKKTETIFSSSLEEDKIKKTMGYTVISKETKKRKEFETKKQNKIKKQTKKYIKLKK